MHRMICLRVTILFLFLSTSLFSQQREFIRGQLFDLQTGEPIPFATIRLKNRALGVISNSDGGFRIPQRLKDLGDTLIISSMGFQKIKRHFSQLSEEHINIIRLKPGILSLTEAVVTAKKKRTPSANAIVKRAIKAIPLNYPIRTFSTVGYYRDYQLKDKEYINLNEAILEVFDKGFDELDSATTAVRIYESVQNNDFQRDHKADNRYNYENWNKIIDRAYLRDHGGNEFVILRVHDAIRNFQVGSFDFVNKLETDFLRNHSFSKSEDIYFEGQELYNILINKRIRGYRVHGRLFISKSDFAIYKMEYALYDDLKSSVSGLADKYNIGKHLIFETITEYKRKYGKMFLNYISFNNHFQLSIPPEFVVNEITVDLPKRCFRVHFNKAVDIAYANQKKNYQIKFNGRKIRFENIVIEDEYVELYPEMKAKELTHMLNEIIAADRKKIELRSLLEIQIKNIRDTEGREINKSTYKEYQQFREYFVQKIHPNKSMPQDGLLMKRWKPIFSDQPLLKPANFEDFWMNTPLQSIE